MVFRILLLAQRTTYDIVSQATIPQLTKMYKNEDRQTWSENELDCWLRRWLRVYLFIYLFVLIGICLNKAEHSMRFINLIMEIQDEAQKLLN